MRKIQSIFFLLAIAQNVLANMASPIQPGTYSGSAFSSRDIDILKEKISIKIDNLFSSATFVVEYFIKADTGGKQVPLLFYAKDYQDGFRVWVDDKEIALQDIPDGLTATANTPFEGFSKAFGQSGQDGGQAGVEIFWEGNMGEVIPLNDLMYFETDLAKGTHLIRVEYKAKAWADRSGWVKEYSFRYALSPAKSWKSFGTLEISVNAPAGNGTVTTDLGRPVSGNLSGTATWQFSGLPANHFQVAFTPQISSFASALIKLGPTGMAIFAGFVLGLIHFFALRKYRQKPRGNSLNPLVIIGSIAIPFCALLCYMLSFGLIDHAIGSHAGHYHGYTFLAFILYPVLMPAYWAFMWLVDRRILAKRPGPVLP